MSDNTMRDNLLVTMACRAGIMTEKNLIRLPVGVEGEDEFAAFCAAAVNKFILEETDEPFDLYIESTLMERFKKQKVYAVQIAPDCQESPLILEDQFWNGEHLVVLGNNRLKEHVTEAFSRLKDNVSTVSEYVDILETLGSEYLKANYGYGSMEEILKDFLWPEGEKDTYSEEELERWGDLLWKYYQTSRVDVACSLMADMYGLMVNTPMAYREIHDSSQGDWNGLYYPADWTQNQFRNFEKEYWNEGTEWTIHEGNSDPESPDEVEGGTTYCYGDTFDQIRHEIAELEGCDDEDVVLWCFEKYRNVPVYEKV